MKRIFTFLAICAFHVASFAQTNPMPCNSSNCTTNAGIDVCPSNSSNVITNFVNPVQKAGNPCSNGLCKGSIWRFSNVATVNGIQVNAEVRIDSIYQAVLSTLDDNTNTNGVSTDLFAPLISPDISIPSGANRRGWVQFSMTFFVAASGDGFTQQQTLANLNLIQYDIDGNGNANTWFRELGNFKQNSGSPQIYADASTELNSDVNTDVSGTWAGQWAGFIGSVCERTGVSKCIEVAASANYIIPTSSLSFRLGYDAKSGGNNAGKPVRQFGIKFGCFNFSTGIQLPVKLLSFGASYNNSVATLTWDVAEETGIRSYDVERSSNGLDFTKIGTVSALNNSIVGHAYTYRDDLMQVNVPVVYYRIRINENAGIAKYSYVVNVRIDKKFTGGMAIMPNPVSAGYAQIRFELKQPAKGEVTIVDASGKIVHRQQVNAVAGTNSVLISDLNTLNSGIYYLRLPIGDQIFYEKLVINRNR
jgi:hypothetical protein